MLSFLSIFFKKRNIDSFAPIPLGACSLTRAYLLEKAGIKDGTAIMIAIPYFTKSCLATDRNISAYAVSEDYHRYFSDLFDELLPLLGERFPEYRFAGFADHSPINEGEACVKAGLGVLGRNGLLITPCYSSYVFLGEIITDAVLPSQIHPMTFCEDCGACKKACPMSKETVGCLSALTQKKGALTNEEAEVLLRYRYAWGCDICQEVCPHTKRAIAEGTIFSPIPFFEKNAISHLDSETLGRMEDEAFKKRAFSWRGRQTIQRNLTLLETQSPKKGEREC